MPALIENLLVEVSRRVTPSPAQRRRLLTLARRLKRQLETAMQGAKLQAEVRIEGSTAKLYLGLYKLIWIGSRNPQN